MLKSKRFYFPITIELLAIAILTALKAVALGEVFDDYNSNKEEYSRVWAKHKMPSNALERTIKILKKRTGMLGLVVGFVIGQSLKCLIYYKTSTRVSNNELRNNVNEVLMLSYVWMPFLHVVIAASLCLGPKPLLAIKAVI